MRAKAVLKDKSAYKNLYIRAAKSHEERLIELNFKSLMNHLEIADHFRFTGSGRLVPRESEAEGNQTGRGRGRGRGCGSWRGRGRGFATNNDWHRNDSVRAPTEDLTEHFIRGGTSATKGVSSARGAAGATSTASDSLAQ